MRLYQVLSTLKHNGDLIIAGEKIELDGEVAKNLENSGIIKLVPEEVPKKEKEKTVEDKDENESEKSEDQEDENEPKLEEMKKSELIELAETLEIEIPSGANKGEIIELIRAQEEEEDEEEL